MNKLHIEHASQVIDEASCIAIAKNKRADTARGYIYQVKVIVRRVSKGDLEDLVRTFGVPAEPFPIKSRGSDAWEVAWTGQKAVRVLEQVLPLLHERKRDARLALAFWSRGGYGDPPVNNLPDRVWDRRDKLYALFQAGKGKKLATRPRAPMGRRAA